MIEPGHFRFSVVGETILKFKARLWFVHRGIEKLFQGRTPQTPSNWPNGSAATPPSGMRWRSARPSRTPGSWCPTTAQRLRAILLELERLYNHVTDIGALCNDVGYSHRQRPRRAHPRTTAAASTTQVTGHRLLRGAIRPGGAAPTGCPTRRSCARSPPTSARSSALALDHSVVRDRFTGTAVLTAEQARDLGSWATSPAPAALTLDARHDHPTRPRPTRTVHTRTEGDVLARFLARAERDSPRPSR